MAVAGAAREAARTHGENVVQLNYVVCYFVSGNV